jgi:hypothetical protein
MNFDKFGPISPDEHFPVHPDWVELNPQPLPPTPPDAGLAGTANTLWKVAINPQPLPPGPPDAVGASDILSKVAINPQPLPPGPDPETSFSANSDSALMSTILSRAMLS